MKIRTEQDSLGKISVPENALYGIHSLRARDNFPDTTPFHKEWFQAMARVKRACYQTALDFREKASDKYTQALESLKISNTDILNALINSALECENNEHYNMFIVPAISGGAGTSINMNINEILCNRALQKLGNQPGDYKHIDPFEDANIFQSTNDVVPTSLHVAAMQLLNVLEEKINDTRSKTEALEREHRDTLRIAYTQMQEAVPTTFGKLFSTYSDALSRDWWRISKCLERIKVVNLGGSAIGTSVAVPHYYTVEVVKTLQQITGLPVTRGENLSDATSNLDSLVEVHGILKAHAVNLEKMMNDLRLLSSDMLGSKHLNIPKKQVGSSIMPGKINPVIPEFVISAVHKVYSNDQLIASLSAQGCLELNAYLPVIGHALLESLKLLVACNVSCVENLLEGISIDTESAREELYRSPSITTALLPYIGYNKADELGRHMKEHRINIWEANTQLQVIDEKKLTEVLKPGNLIQGSYRLKDL